MTDVEFEGWYRSHSPRIRDLAKRLLQNAHDADEIVQETFARAFVAQARIDPAIGAEAWLITTARNACIDRIRARRRRPEALTDSPPDEVAPTGADVHELFEGRERSRVLEEVVRQLGPTEQRIFRLRHFDGYTHREIASLEQISPAAARARMSRTEKAFRRLWREASRSRGLSVLIPGRLIRRFRRTRARCADQIRFLDVSTAGAWSLAIRAAGAAVAIAIVLGHGATDAADEQRAPRTPGEAVSASPARYERDVAHSDPSTTSSSKDRTIFAKAATGVSGAHAQAGVSKSKGTNQRWTAYLDAELNGRGVDGDVEHTVHCESGSVTAAQTCAALDRLPPPPDQPSET